MNASPPSLAPSLADEARYLHACFFSAPLDPVVIARYEAAHREMNLAGQPAAVVSRVVEKRLDAEAVEFALRRRGLGKELTTKIQILCYIVEVRSAYLSEFVNTKSMRARAVAELFGATLQTAWKLVKGEYLVRRHGLL
jgi:hypothetical protein